MKKSFSITVGFIALLTVYIQFYLMIENRISSIYETIFRFFSFFTILTNLLVGIYFLFSYINQKKGSFLFISKPGILTSVTVYITIVGLVYQFALRHVWEPKGLQMIVDELLHSIIPFLVIVFWYFYEYKNAVHYKVILKWLLYPIIYLMFILLRGYFSNYYPYPFINVGILGVSKVIVNSFILVFAFTFISLLFVKIGHKISKT